jgi:hypothetical protein
MSIDNIMIIITNKKFAIQKSYYYIDFILIFSVITG